MSLANYRNPQFTGLSCFACGRAHDPARLQTVCDACGMPLRVDYDSRAARRWPDLRARGRPSLWRYREVLPICAARRDLARRGLDAALAGRATACGSRTSRATRPARSRRAAWRWRSRWRSVLGARALAAPSAGNAAGALAAYGAAARAAGAWWRCPTTRRAPFVAECGHYGAEVQLVRRHHRRRRQAGCASTARADAFDVSTLQASRIASRARRRWRTSCASSSTASCPTSSSTRPAAAPGLVGMWKAFDEMRELGWPRARRPRLRLRAGGRAARRWSAAFARAAREATEPWPNAQTRAYGLRVPVADRRHSSACARCARPAERRSPSKKRRFTRATRALAARTGLDICPEGGAAWAAYEQLLRTGFITPTDRVVLFNTGTGLKYR